MGMAWQFGKPVRILNRALLVPDADFIIGSDQSEVSVVFGKTQGLLGSPENTKPAGQHFLRQDLPWLPQQILTEAKLVFNLHWRVAKKWISCTCLSSY